MPECAATITPDSRLGELLERWPALEDVLVQLSPHFRALRNPVLRRTVAKVATLRKVSSVSGVYVYQLLTPFIPAPLVDLARSKGFRSYSVTEGDTLVRTFFSKGHDRGKHAHAVSDEHAKAGG